MSPLESAHEQLLALDLARLPPAVRATFVVQPLLSVPIEADGEGFKVVSWASLPAAAPRALFAKLGVKSWRDGGSLRVMYAGVPMRPALESMLAAPTRAQRLAARAWLDNDVPLELHLFPYVDFTDISESRWLVDPRAINCLSVCERGASATRLRGAVPHMHRLAQAIGTALPPRRTLVDIAGLPDGSVRLVDINPGLSLSEIDALTSA